MSYTTGESELRNVLNQPEPELKGVNSVYDRLHIIEEHLHNVSVLSPELQDPILLTAGTGAWSDTGALTQILATGVTTAEWDVHYLNISDMSATGYFEMKLYAGTAAAATAIGSMAAARSSNFAQEGNQPCLTRRITAGSGLFIRLRSSPVAATTLRVKVVYHEY